MKTSLTLIFVLILSFSSILCQEIEDQIEDVDIIPPINTSPKGTSGDNPITSITTTIANGTMSIFNRLADKISSGWQRMRGHVQERYQRTMERLQRRAVDAMEKLQEYVQKRVTSATDDTTKQYLERLNSGIQQITDQLRNLMTNVETKVEEKGQQFKRIPEYKFGDQ